MEDPLPAPGLIPVPRYGWWMEVMLHCGHRTILEVPTHRYLAYCAWYQASQRITCPVSRAERSPL